MKESIRAYAQSIGIPRIGVTTLGEQWAIVCLFPYFSGYHEGNLSVYCYGPDYHKVLREKLDALAAYIHTLAPSAQTESFADIGPSVEKDLAFHAGLGFYGRNSLLINDEFGSYCFIGYLLTDLPLSCDAPLTRTCAQCGRCKAACPGGAIGEVFRADRCASCINQTKGDLTPQQQAIMRRAGYVFGCDICQRVCPHNQITPRPMAEFTKDPIYNLTEEMLRPLTNRTFSEQYGDRAFSWRGLAILRRNLAILKN